MSPRFLSEPEAWREIAHRLEARGDVDYGDGYLCLEVDSLRDDEVADATRKAMIARVRGHVFLIRGIDCGFSSPAAYNDPSDPVSEDRHARILAAYWMALEAEDDAREAKADAQ